MENAKYIIKMEILNLKELQLMEMLKDMEKVFMKMVNIIQENGKMASKMEKGNYMIKTEILNMKETLLMANLKEAQTKNL